jgi:hypothetical protein
MPCERTRLKLVAQKELGARIEELGGGAARRQSSSSSILWEGEATTRNRLPAYLLPNSLPGLYVKQRGRAEGGTP